MAADASAEEDPLFTLGLTWVHRGQGVETGKRAFTISIDYAQASYD